LYNDNHETAYDIETMFAQVSATLPTLRRWMATPPSHPDVFILAPPVRSYEAIGAERASVLLEVQPYRRLAILAKEGVNAAVVDSLSGWSLDGVRAIVALSPGASYLTGDDLAILRGFLGRGGNVVTSPGVAAALAPATATAPQQVFDGLVAQWGTLYAAQKGIAVLFEDQRHEVLSGFWQEVLGLDASQPGYRIVTDQVVFHYHVGAEPVAVRWDLPFEAAGSRYDDQARPVEWVHDAHLAATLGRREYVLLMRIPWFRPCARGLDAYGAAGISKEGWRAARVPAKHRLVGADLAPRDEADRPGHRLRQHIPVGFFSFLLHTTCR
jgi:hypothetical protein